MLDTTVRWEQPGPIHRTMLQEELARRDITVRKEQGPRRNVPLVTIATLLVMLTSLIADYVQQVRLIMTPY